MTLGHFIKQIRTQKGLSQPQLAEQMCVEQSYLSKLENDKSVPSNEVFRKLLTALNLSLDECMQTLSTLGKREELSQIPDIEYWYKQHQQSKQKQYKQLAIFAILLVSFGVGLFWSGYKQIFFSERLFEYESQGVLQAGEPVELYRKWRFLLVPHSKNSDLEFVEQVELAMAKRLDKKTELFSDYRGGAYTESVTDGRRHYRFQGSRFVERVENAWLQFVGLLCLSAGVMLTLVGKRLVKP
ncbi:helix-turn-helix domain-containing protein [Pseudoalteromonas sp. DY56-GL79]|uniref:helix-turn-helix domain-containing protein n=1 Tax=Pseudoalteromonas sp. DY56-GL79 TaxID=2967131 RepID=UPI00352ABF1D